VQKHRLHFDAKYRLEPADVVQLLHDGGEDAMADADDDEVGYEQEISRLHRREDLFKMHTYRDGILSTRGAYILFPGDGTGIRLEGETQNFFIRQILFRRSSRPIRTTSCRGRRRARRHINPTPIHFNLRTTAHRLTPEFSSTGFSLCGFNLDFYFLAQ